LMESCVQCADNTVPEARCDPPYLTGGTVQCSQQDGVLSFVGTDGSSASGGVWADGTFIIGTIAPLVTDDGVRTGQVLWMMDGTFYGPSWIIGHITWRMTGNESDGRTCDLQSVNAVTFEQLD